MRYPFNIRIWRGHGPKSNSQTSDGFDCTAPEISLFKVDTSKSPAVLSASSAERVLMVMVMVERSKRRRLSRRPEPKRLPKSLVCEITWRRMKHSETGDSRGSSLLHLGISGLHFAAS